MISIALSFIETGSSDTRVQIQRSTVNVERDGKRAKG